MTADGDIVEAEVVDSKFSCYKNPWDDPYSDLSKYYNARAKGVINDDTALSSVSAAVDLVSFRNLDDWCYVEEFDKTIFTQVELSRADFCRRIFLSKLCSTYLLALRIGFH